MALEGDGWLTPRPGRFTPRNEPLTIVQEAEEEDFRYQIIQPTNSVFFPHGSSAVEGLGLLIAGVSRSQSDTIHSVRLLWMSDQPDAEESVNTQHSEEKHVHTLGGIRTHKPHPTSGRRPMS